MSNGAKLKFPRWFNATGASLNMTDSTITGFDGSEIQNSGLDLELNDDGPIIAWTGATTATLYRTRIDHIHQDSRFSEGGRAGTANFTLTLSGASPLCAHDAYSSADQSHETGAHH